MSSAPSHAAQQVPAARPQRMAVPSDGLAGSRTSANAELFADADKQDAASLDAWSRRVAASSGFGDAANTGVAVAMPAGASVGADSGLPTARATDQSGVAGIVDLIAVWAGALADALRGAVHRWLARQRVMATVRELSGLSDHTLRDIGLNRSEILSAALESERALSGHTLRVHTHRMV